MEASKTHGLAIRIAGEIVISQNPNEGIRKWRRIFEVSQVDLAGHMKVSPSVISDYESGRRHSPRVDTIKRVIDSLFEIDMSRGGRVINTLERMMLVGDGISRKDDTLPKRYFEEPIPEGPAKGCVIERTGFDRILDEYYRLHGWDRDGIPTKRTLKRLGIKI